MKILILQASPRANGNTAWMAEEYKKAAETAGHEVTLVNVARKKIAGCLACEYCHNKGNGACIQKDDMQELYPLVTVVNHANPMASDLNHSRLNYGLYALFLKQGDGCSIRYGREKYDYQEGTVVSFKPGQVVEVEWDESRPMDMHWHRYRWPTIVVP